MFYVQYVMFKYCVCVCLLYALDVFECNSAAEVPGMHGQHTRHTNENKRRVINYI